MNQWMYFAALISFVMVIYIEGRRSLYYTNAFEYHVDECLTDRSIGKKKRDQCCQDYCSANTKCYFGQSRRYPLKNSTADDVCLCYTCRPKEWFKVRNRIANNDTIEIDFPYCTILLPHRADELCHGYCSSGEKCSGYGRCGVDSDNERMDRCMCEKCPSHNENFQPVFDPMF